MDVHLFQNLVPRGTLPEDGPLNRARLLVDCMSIWWNGPHEAFPPCSFDDYLVVRGWDKDKLLFGQWRSAHASNHGKADGDIVLDAIAVIQSWLTLGFLEAVFQTRVSVEKYTRLISPVSISRMRQDPGFQSLLTYLQPTHDDQIRAFHTKHFVSNLVALNLGFQMGLPSSRSPGEAHEHEQRIRSAFTEYARTLELLNDLEKYNPATDTTSRPVDPEHEDGSVFFWILIFPTLLAETVRLHLPKCIPDVTIEPPRIFEQAVREHLKRNNWCPYTLEKLVNTTNYSVLHWLWAMDFHGLSRQSHDECDPKRCKAAFVDDEASYPTEHVRGCNGTCDRYFAPIDAVATILQSGDIPVIIAHRTSMDAAEYIFEVEKFDASSEYASSFAAFSHVWADGFGSTTEKGITTCQLQFLADASLCAVEKPPGSTAF